jgi:Spy/CpxP family protein refolding chaperone
MKRFLGAMAVAILLVAVATLLAAQPGVHGANARQNFGNHQGLGRILNNPDFRTKLGITDEQYAKLKNSFLDSEKVAIRTRADLQIKRLELANLMSADNVDRTQVNQKISDIGALETALMKNHIETQLAVKDTLTPEQLKKFQQWRQNQRGRFLQERMQPGRDMMRQQDRPGRMAPPPPPPAAPSKPGDDRP